MIMDFIDDNIELIIIGGIILFFISGFFQGDNCYASAEANRICNALGYETYVTYDRVGKTPKNLVCGTFSDRRMFEMVAEGKMKPYVINNETVFVGDFGTIKKADKKCD